MKKYSFFILIALFACNAGTKPVNEAEVQQGTILPATADYLVTIDASGNCSSCEECASVSYALESDTLMNKVMAAYLYNAIIGGYECKLLTRENIEKMMERESFVKVMLLFLGDNKYKGLHYIGDSSLLMERAGEMIYRLDDLNMARQHVIADTLLSIGNNIGLTILWEKAEISKLSHLGDYLNRMDTGNFFLNAEMAAFFHNINNLAERDIYLEKAKKDTMFADRYQSLITLIETNKKFDVMTFKEEIYGGQ